MLTRELRACLLGVGSALLLQSLGCATQVDDIEKTEVAKQVAPLTKEEGQALFREILFPNSESAKRSETLKRLYEYSDLANRSPEQHKAIESVQGMLVAGVDDLDPEFFERFAKSVTSGNVQEVDKAVREASALLQESLRGWNEVLDKALSEEGLAELHKRLEKDERSQVLRELTKLDRETAKKLAVILREQLVPVPDDTPFRIPARQIDLIPARQIDLVPTRQIDIIPARQIDLVPTRQISRQTFVPPVLDHVPSLDLQLQSPRSIALQLQLPNRAIDIQRNLQLQLQRQLPINAVDLARQGDVAYVADVTVDVETVVYAVVAVAVAVVAVVVAVFGRPIDEAATYLNGKELQLFREQMIAEISVGYAR